MSTRKDALYSSVCKQLTKAESDRDKYKADADGLAEVMKDFAEYGTRHDLNPTTRFGMKEQARLMWAIDRFRSMDNYVKDKARAALAAHQDFGGRA